MRILTLFLLASAVCAGAVHAQTQAAGSSLSTQQTWNRLSESLRQTDTKVDAVNTRLDQSVVCAKKTMIYSPGEAGIDSDGCKPAAVPAIVSTTITNTVNEAISATTVINKIINCNDGGQVYDPKSNVCKAIIQPNLVQQVKGVAPAGESYATATCPAGTALMGCAGSRDPNYNDDGGEESHKFYGAGPISSMTCKSAARNGHTSVWAYCLKISN